MVLVARWIVTGLGLVAAVGCGSAESGSLAPVPGANDLSIRGIWAPAAAHNGTCDFERPDFEPAEDIFIRLFDPEAPIAEMRTLPVRVRRDGEARSAPSRLRLVEARARWKCREDENPYRRDWWPDQGLDPADWSYLPLDIPGWARPFCAPDIDAAQIQTLKTAPLTLELGEEGTAWVELIDPPTRRALVVYEELAFGAAQCLDACPPGGLCRIDVPLAEFNPPYCARFIERHQEFFGASEAPPMSIGAALFFYSRTLRGLLMHVEVTLHFEDEHGFPYEATMESEIGIAFSHHYVEYQHQGLYTCYERDF